MKILNAVLLVLLGHFSYAQNCVVVDKDSEIPISNVHVMNEDQSKSVVSDRNGIVNLGIFEDMELLTFNHVSYVEMELIKKNIRKEFTTVYLQFKSELLEEVYLSASKEDLKRSRIAEEIAISSIKDIQNSGSQSSADMLARIPGVRVQKTQFGGGSPVLRGMESNRILMVIDGVRMNNAIYRKGHVQNSITVAPSLLEKTEVIFGPSSVIYGSDALGGVIHYYTRKPEVSERNNVNLEFLGRYSTVNDEKTMNASVEMQFENIATFTSITFSQFGDLKMGDFRPHGFEDWGLQNEYSDNTDSYYNDVPIVNSDPTVQRNVGYDQTDFLQKIFIPIMDDDELMFNFQYSTSSHINRFDKLTERRNGKLRFAQWYYGPQQRMLLSSQYVLNLKKPWADKGTFTAAYQDIEESRIDRRFESDKKRSKIENVQVYSINGDFSKKMKTTINRNFGYGFEIAYNKVNSTAKGEVLDIVNNRIIGVKDTYTVQTRYPDGGSSYLSSAIYASYRQDIGKKSTLNTGLRITNTVLSAKWIDTTFIKLEDDNIESMNTSINMTVGYAFKPTPDWQLNAVISSGFRSPNIDDIGKVREKNGNVTVPNVDLKPEFAYNFETGFLKYFDEKKTHIGISTYYTLLRDYIVRAPYLINGNSQIIYDGELANVMANVNRGNAYVLGGTMTFRSQLTNTWSTRASITYTQGATYDTGEPMSSIPPLFGNVEFNYVRNRIETGINFIFNGKKEAEDYNISEGIDNIEQTPYLLAEQAYYGSPSWYTVNYYIRIKTSKFVDLIINVDNILDQHYREFASAISAPGRNFSMTLIGSF